MYPADSSRSVVPNLSSFVAGGREEGEGMILHERQVSVRIHKAPFVQAGMYACRSYKWSLAHSSMLTHPSSMARRLGIPDLDDLSQLASAASSKIFLKRFLCPESANQFLSNLQKDSIFCTFSPLISSLRNTSRETLDTALEFIVRISLCCLLVSYMTEEMIQS